MTPELKDSTYPHPDTAALLWRKEEIAATAHSDSQWVEWPVDMTTGFNTQAACLAYSEYLKSADFSHYKREGSGLTVAEIAEAINYQIRNSLFDSNSVIHRLKAVAERLGIDLDLADSTATSTPLAIVARTPLPVNGPSLVGEPAADGKAPLAHREAARDLCYALRDLGLPTTGPVGHEARNLILAAFAKVATPTVSLLQERPAAEFWATSEWLDKLAKAAEQAKKGWASNICGWHPASNLQAIHGLDATDSAYIDAARPDTILALLAENARLRAAALPQYQQERGGANDFDPLDEVKEWLEGIKSVLDKVDNHKGTAWEALLKSEHSEELVDFANWAYIFLEHRLLKSKAAASPTPVATVEGSGWVSVDERLPEFDQGRDAVECVVLAGGLGGRVTIATYRRQQYAATERGRRPRWEKNHQIYVGAAITHWQPLPAAPSQKGAGNE